MLATYAEVTDTTIAQGWEVEDRVSREWEGSGFDPAEIEARRLGIVERGRSQIGKGVVRSARGGRFRRFSALVAPCGR